MAFRPAARTLSLIAAWLSAAALVTSTSARNASFVLLGHDGAPLGGVSVSVVGRAGSTVTDSDGRFRLDPEPTRPYDLVAFDQSGTVLGSVRVVEGDGVELTLVPTEFESVRVVSGVAPSTSAPPAAAATVLSREETERLQPARLVDTLEEVPGANAVGSGQSAVPAVRGLARGRTLLLLDDARVTAERRAGPSGTYLNPFALENVEIVRGPGSVAYGSDAIGGVIHARTPRPRTDELSGRYELAAGAGEPFGSAAAEIGVPYGDASAVLFQAHGRRYGDYDSPSGEVANSSARGAGGLIRGVTSSSAARYTWGVQVDRGRDLERPASDTDRRVTIYPEEDSDRVTFAVDLTGSERWTATELRAFVGRYRLVTERETFATEASPRNVTTGEVDSFDASVRAVAGRRIASGSVRFGLDVVSRFGLEATDRRVEYPSDGEPVVTRDQTTIESARKIDTGMFVEFDRVFGARGTTLAVGARVDHVGTENQGGFFGDESTSNVAPSGYLAIRVPVLGSWEVTLQAARGFRDPTLSDRYFRGTTGRGTVTGNPELDPETSRQYDVAFQGVAGSVRVAVFAYLYRIEDLIERYEVAPGEFAFRNRAEQELYGAESEIDVELTRRLSGRLAVQWARGTIVDDGTPAADVPAPAVTVSLDHRVTERWWWRVASRIQARDDRPGEQEIETPGFARLDLAAGWRPGERLEVRLLLGNVLDREYPASADVLAPPAPGFTASLALSGRF